MKSFYKICSLLFNILILLNTVYAQINYPEIPRNYPHHNVQIQESFYEFEKLFDQKQFNPYYKSKNLFKNSNTNNNILQSEKGYHVNKNDLFKISNSVKESWVRHYGSGLALASDEPVDVAVDDSGYIYVTGMSTNAPYSSDYYTIKYDSSGNEIWSVRYNSPENGDDIPVAICVDKSGNVYVTGYSSSKISAYDYLTIKYNAAGQLQWSIRYDGTAKLNDKAAAIAIDNECNIYVTGSSYNIYNNEDILTIKYSSTGTIIWIANYNGPDNLDDEAVDLAIDDSNNVYVTGKSRSSSCGWNFITVKYNSLGMMLWNASFNRTNYDDFPSAISIDRSGNVIVVGQSTDSISEINHDYTTIKYNSSGIAQWIQHYDLFPFDQPTDLVIDTLGNVYITGISGSPPFISVGTYSSRYLTLKYDTFGNLIWSKQFKPGVENIATEIAIDFQMNVIVTGFVLDTLSTTYYDYATIKYNSNGDSLWVAYFNAFDITEFAKGIAVDKSGNIYVTGVSYNFPTWFDYATVKYNPGGIEQWNRRYHGPANSIDQGDDIAVDQFGNIYVTGSSTSSITYDDYLTIKYKSNGDILWYVRYNDEEKYYNRATEIAVDKQGNCYVSGHISIPLQSEITSFDIATVKYDESGNLVWIRKYNSPSDNVDIPTDLTLDEYSNVYITGFSYKPITGFDYLTIKYDKDGNEKWVAQYDGFGHYDYSQKIVVDKKGNVYITGTSIGQFTGSDYTTIKYDSSGNQIWVARYNNVANSSDDAYDLALDDSGNVYVTGSSKNIFGEPDYLTIKYDPDGNEVWSVRYDAGFNSYDGANALVTDEFGNVYVTGMSTLVGIGSPDIATIKYDANGNQLWVSRYNSPANGQDEPKDICIDKQGNIYVCGNSSGIGTESDITTIKYNNDGEVVWALRYNSPFNYHDVIMSMALDNQGNIALAGYSLFKGGRTFCTIRYVQEKKLPFIMERGWNMVSIPLEVNDYRKTTLFPTAISPAWIYQPDVGYIPKDTLANCVGYWLKFGIDEVTYMTGFPIPIDTFDLVEGWNMVGSISEPVDVNTIEFIPGDITRSKFFGYRSGYYVTDTLQPGKGYWVKVNQPAKMILSANGVLKSTIQQKLYVTDELPPPPPESEFADIRTQIPTEFKLEQNYPNPFNTMTIIKYQIPIDCWVILKVYNILGQEVATLVDGMQDAGYKSVVWNAEKYPSSVYYIKMNAGKLIDVKKVVLIR